MTARQDFIKLDIPEQFHFNFNMFSAISSNPGLFLEGIEEFYHEDAQLRS